MSDGPEDPDKRNTASEAEVSADILGRALAHVEQLLQRMEYAPIQVLDESTGPAGAAAGRAEETPRSGAAPAAPATSSPARTHSVPIHTSAQAEALRITLSAHDEANRVRAEAAAVRAEAASEGERILVEAQQVAEELHTDAQREADALRAEAYRSAESLKSEMEAAAQAVRRAAVEEADALKSAARREADTVRGAASEEADRIRAEAALWAQEQRRAVDLEVDQALTKAVADGEAIRRHAEDEGRVEAARQVDVAVRAAVAAAHDEAEAALDRSLELLGGAGHTVAGLRDTVGQMVASMTAALTALSGTGAQVEELLTLTQDFRLPELPQADVAVALALGVTDDSETTVEDTDDAEVLETEPADGESDGALETGDADTEETEAEETEAEPGNGEADELEADDEAGEPAEGEPDASDEPTASGEGDKPQRRPLGALFGPRA